MDQVQTEGLGVVIGAAVLVAFMVPLFLTFGWMVKRSFEFILKKAIGSPENGQGDLHARFDGMEKRLEEGTAQFAQIDRRLEGLPCQRRPGPCDLMAADPVDGHGMVPAFLGGERKAAP